MESSDDQNLEPRLKTFNIWVVFLLKIEKKSIKILVEQIKLLLNEKFDF